MPPRSASCFSGWSIEDIELASEILHEDTGVTLHRSITLSRRINAQRVICSYVLFMKLYSHIQSVP